MIIKLFLNKKYKNMIKKQIHEQLKIILEVTNGFSISVKLSDIEFSPKLPKDISEKFSKITLFTLVNYTFESIILEDDYISFEAGFGAKNIEAIVKVPYGSIFQILMDKSIIFTNPSSTLEKNTVESNIVSNKERSMNAFMSNPNNKHLL